MRWKNVAPKMTLNNKELGKGYKGAPQASEMGPLYFYFLIVLIN